MKTEISSTGTMPVSHIELLQLSSYDNGTQGYLWHRKACEDGHWDLPTPFGMILGLEDDDFFAPNMKPVQIARVMCHMDSGLFIDKGAVTLLLRDDKTAEGDYASEEYIVHRDASAEKILTFMDPQPGERQAYLVPISLLGGALSKLAEMGYSVSGWTELQEIVDQLAKVTRPDTGVRVIGVGDPIAMDDPKS